VSFQHWIGVTVFAAALYLPAAKAQAPPIESAARASSLPEESNESGHNLVAASSFEKREAPGHRANFAGHFHKKQFVVLSAAVYGAGLADMHQTMHNRNYPWWYEKDPLARPMVRSPAPAYYATGLALTTGVNWLSWKMGHSRRWHKLALLPQLLSIAGNTYGFKSNCHPNH